MVDVQIKIKNNTHQLSCKEGEEVRLKQLSEQFTKKVEELSLSLPWADDKTLYLIAGLVFLDKLEEQEGNSNSESNIDTQQIAASESMEQVTQKIEGLINKYEKYGNVHETA